MKKKEKKNYEKIVVRKMKKKTDTEECQELIKKFKNYCLQRYKELQADMILQELPYLKGQRDAYRDIMERLSYLEVEK